MEFGVQCIARYLTQGLPGGLLGEHHFLEVEFLGVYGEFEGIAQFRSIDQVPRLLE